jgi:dTMP kinase
MGDSMGVFVTFEGVEGSGKSLQIRRAAAQLERQGVSCLLTREPGGTAFGAAVRHVLLDRDGAARTPMSELLLYLSDRHQHLRETIEPALARGVIVLSDRYHDATRAYQGAARGVPAAALDELARVLAIPEPDFTILLDLDPELGLERARRRNADDRLESQGRFEAEAIEFHRAVRAAYLDLARRWPDRFRIVPAAGSPDEVFARIEPLIAEWIRALAGKGARG